MSRRVTVSCPGSCGELFQGVIGEKEYLVTLPIEIYNTVTIELSDQASFPNCSKLKQAFELTCDYFNYLLPERPIVQVDYQPSLPLSKGMSSSTADLTAMIYSTSHLLKQTIDEQTVAKICCQIENTDSLVFSNLTVMNGETSDVLYSSNWQPEMKVLVLESRNTLDTADFHRERSTAKVFEQSAAYHELFKQFQEAVAEKSLTKIGQISTASSILNQELLPKPHFQELLSFVERYDLLGVMVAHSGTVVGFLLENNRDFPETMLDELTKNSIIEHYPTYYVTKTTFGGPRFL